MEMIELYIPRNIVESEESIRSFYSFYEELSSERPFNNNNSIKDKLLKKAEDLHEPILKKYIEENF